MKLHRAVVNEMTGPIPYELTLTEIIYAGDATNHYQVYVLALLSQFFKNGNQIVTGRLENLEPFSSDATSVSVIESIKSLSPSDKVKLAQYLLDCVTVGASALHNQHLSSLDWINFVLRRQ